MTDTVATTPQLKAVDTAKIAELEAALAELKRRQQDDPIGAFEPYPKQLEFLTRFADYKASAIFAGSQAGKSKSVALLAAMTALGRYPSWYDGWKPKRRNPIIWVIGETAEAVRDSIQRKLIGAFRPWGAPGSMILEKDIASVSLGRGVQDAVDTIVLRNGASITFKSYARGRGPLQGATVDLVVLDEEPPADIFSEVLARTAATKGRVVCAFTPLRGMSEVVRRFMEEDADDFFYVRMSLTETKHYSPADIAELARVYRPHELKSRIEGIPLMGAGTVFPFAESVITTDPFPIPSHWFRLVGIDFGIKNFAAVCIAIDRDTDTIYLTDEFEADGATIASNTAAIRQRWGGEVRCVWPLDMMKLDSASGKALRDVFKSHGLNMTEERASLPDGSNGVEAMIAEMADRFETGRLKIFPNCTGFLREYRGYIRDENTGKIRQEYDHVLDACRYAVCSHRFATQSAVGANAARRRRARPRIALGMDYDIFGERP